jgi:outer membrane protein OmpA-like peptidoglycan-associated protein
VAVADTGQYTAAADSSPFLLVGDVPAPVAPPATTHGDATTTVTVEGVSEDASLSIDPDFAFGTHGVGSVQFNGLSFSVACIPGFSGIIELPITVTHEGASAVIIARITVNPADPYDVTFGPTSATKTRVQWAGSLGATGYRIYVGGCVVATVGTNVSSLTISRLLGPNSGVAVQAIGDDGTGSAIVRGVYRPGVNVKIGTITFWGDSAKLTIAAKRTLNTLAALVKSQGFTSLTIRGFTEKHAHGSAKFRKKLSAARAAAVKSYLLDRFRHLHVRVAISVVSSTGTSATTSVKYRRAEIVLQ